MTVESRENSVVMPSAAFARFATGDYAGVLAGNALESSATADWPWIIGALSFVGRAPEAEAIFAAHAVALSPADAVAARFFLAVAAAREGQHDKARKLCALNRRTVLAHGGSDPRSQFFAAQGLAFLRYVEGRFSVAHLWAKAALAAATGANFLFGAVFALELLAHVELNVGQIRAGLRTMAQARARAERLGHGAVLDGIDAATRLYRASYGLTDHAAIGAELSSSYAASNPEAGYSYSKAELAIELARVRLLEGRVTAAKALLEASSQFVYQVDNPALEVTHNICFAELLRRQGEPYQALTLVRSALIRADLRPNAGLRLKLLGVKEKLLADLGLESDRQKAMLEIAKLTARHGSWIARRMLARRVGVMLPEARPGEDALGDLIDLARHHQGSQAATTAVVESGWLSLLPEQLGLKATERIFYFDAEPSSLTVIDRGEVVHWRGGCTHFTRKFIMILAGGEASKETIAKHLWEQSYHPLRHDALIYSLIAKTRKLLGDRGAWIEACEIGYRLARGVKVEARDLRGVPAEMPWARASAAGPVGLPAAAAALNSRQVTILEWLQAGETVDPKAAMERLMVSDATASRDLGGIVALGLAQRVGKGRSTRYALAAEAKSN